MKSIILGITLAGVASAALASDIGFPYKAVPMQSYNWNGFYAGVHGGYVTGDPVVTDTNGGVKPGPFTYNSSGGFGGGQAGYNWQIHNFLIGAEAELGYMGLTGKGVIGSASAISHQDLTLNSGMYANITGRLGITVGQLLIYGKGGYSYLDTNAKQTTTNPGYATTGTGAYDGYGYGGGVEYMFLPNWSAKVEYMRFDYGTKTGYQTNVGDISSPIGYKFMNATSLKLDTIKAGVNYHF